MTSRELRMSKGPRGKGVRGKGKTACLSLLVFPLPLCPLTPLPLTSLRAQPAQFNSVTASLRGAIISVALLLACTAVRARGEEAPPQDVNPHGRIDMRCSLCHSAEGWVPAAIDAAFDHAKLGFPLQGAHAAATCRSCHADLKFAKTPVRCVDCHADPHLGELGVECARCHNPRSFLDRAGMQRVHSASSFPLTGSHLGVDCDSCHRPAAQGHMRYVNTPTDCYSCHRSDYAATKEPDHQAAGFPTTCATCHSTMGWSAAHFDHAAGRFPLSGAHRTLACATCHGDGSFSTLPTACVSCHRAAYDATTNPSHAALGYPTACESCHQSASWQPASFNHQATGFALTGAHAAVACTGCHGDGVYKGKSPACYSCHKTDYDGATAPNHRSAGFPTDCVACHTSSTWTGATFNHAQTNFPLTGAHTAQACTACHGDGVYRGKSPLCVSCHQNAFNATADPKHSAAGFAATCQDCHSTAAWSGGRFDHASTAFALTGAHQALHCNSCHADAVYRGKSTACYSCHQTDYDGATAPNHRSAGFPTDCVTCHTVSAWAGAVFNHAQTNFPLAGAHAAQACSACHGDGVYRGKSTLCASCHQNVFNATVDPKHTAAGFATTCQDCHGTSSWSGGRFDHGTTGFPLTGAHQSRRCNSCHADAVYRGKSTACYSCHRTDYEGATDPNHRSAGFPTDCIVCHGSVSWAGAAFNHAQTNFPLTGAHAAQACSACHGDGVYRGKSTLCASCHQNAFNATVDPKHTAAGFATTCQDCHGTASWSGGRFNHGSTAFALTGAHASLRCNSCHADAVYRGKSTACYSCHKSDYDGAADPNHRAAGFPTDCVACHGTLQWAGARFDHDAQYFPIYSGKHRGRWATCATCHPNSNSYAVFDCLGCHPHSDRAGTDREHRNRPGYSYDSAACYRCHRNGEGD